MKDIKGNLIEVGDAVVFVKNDRTLKGNVTIVYGNGIECTVDGVPNVRRVLKLES